MATPERNFAHQTIWTGDNLEIMRGMNSGCIDLIYLDPPFNSHRNYSGIPKSASEGVEFKDTWTAEDIDPAWEQIIESGHETLSYVIKAATAPSDKSYLIYMAVRLLEMRRILADTGSIYLHCDPTMSHYLKLVMDAIFGRKQFRNEIVWCYSTGGASKRRFAQKHDLILLYHRGPDGVLNVPRMPYTSAMSRDPKHIHKFHPDGKIMTDWWSDIPPLNPQAKERCGYPTQKPVLLIQRILRASTPPRKIKRRTENRVWSGGAEVIEYTEPQQTIRAADEAGVIAIGEPEPLVLLDPFCGCATSCIAAELEAWEWAGIDLSYRTVDLAQTRMQNELGLYWQGAHYRGAPQRTDL